MGEQLFGFSVYKEGMCEILRDQICVNIFFGAMVGLRINPDKSKEMTVCAPASRISIQGADVENVDNFRYLGSLISTDNSCEKDVLSRICLAQAYFPDHHVIPFLHLGQLRDELLAKDPRYQRHLTPSKCRGQEQVPC